MNINILPIIYHKDNRFFANKYSKNVNKHYLFFLFPQPRESKTHPVSDTMKYGGAKTQPLQINGLVHTRRSSGVKGSEVSISGGRLLVGWGGESREIWGGWDIWLQYHPFLVWSEGAKT